MPKDKGYEKGKTQSAVLVQQPLPAKKTNVPRKGKRNPGGK
jgi:hypothetical protein